MRRRAAGDGGRACTAWLGRGWGNPVGTTPNLGPLWIALKGGSVTSCTADVGVDPRGGGLLSQPTAPAVGPTTGKGFAPPQSVHPFTLAANAFTRSGTGRCSGKEHPSARLPQPGKKRGRHGDAPPRRLGVPRLRARSGRCPLAGADTTWAHRGDPGPSRARARCTASRGQKLAPPAALLTPVEGGGDRLQIGQEDGIAAPLRRRQKQQRFLDVGG